MVELGFGLELEVLVGLRTEKVAARTLADEVALRINRPAARIKRFPAAEGFAVEKAMPAVRLTGFGRGLSLDHGFAGVLSEQRKEARSPKEARTAAKRRAGCMTML